MDGLSLLTRHRTKVSLWIVYISCWCDFSETIAIC